MNLDKFKIGKNCTIHEGLILIEENHLGTLFVIDEGDRVIGAVTDGDVRRHLLNGGDINEPIIKISNGNFIHINSGSSRELLIKHLDSRAKLIPVLSTNGKLLNVVSRNNLPNIREGNIQVRSRAPVRISFGGGGSDLTNYFHDQSGAVINSTINIYTHVLLSPRSDGFIHITSHDLNQSLGGKNLQEVLNANSDLKLIQAVLKVVKPSFGFDLVITSDFPVGSGLGGSATVAVAILGAFNYLRVDKWTKYEIAELAFEAERFHMEISGGWQDQYASVFGGLNFMEFVQKKNLVMPLNLDKETLLELSANLILCDTGLQHQSGTIHDDQKQKVLDQTIREKVRENVQLTYAMRDSLLVGDLNMFGENLNSAWNLKKQFSEKISNLDIDDIFAGAIKNGALGGKLLGAGGGGFFLFYCNPITKPNVTAYLKFRGLKIYHFSFESNGLATWAVRK